MAYKSGRMLLYGKDAQGNPQKVAVYNAQSYKNYIASGFSETPTSESTTKTGYNPQGNLSADNLNAYKNSQSSTTQMSLVDIYDSRPDLKQAFPQGLVSGSADNKKLNDWWNQNGVKEYPNVTLTSTSPSTTTSPTATPESTTGDEYYDGLLSQMQTYLDEIKQRGQTINPNVTITPDQLAEFMSQAEREIDPYYSTQMKLAKDQLLTSLGYTKEDLDTFESDMEQKYGKQLRTYGENMAETGMARSGSRQVGERELATETQQSIDTNRTTAERNARSLASNYAQTWGGSNLPTTTVSSKPTVQAGISNFSRGSGSSLYNLSSDVYDDLVGSAEYEKQTNIKTRASQLEEAFKQSELDKQYRQLTL